MQIFNSAPERYHAATSEQLSELQAASDRTDSRLESIEETLELIKGRLLDGGPLPRASGKQPADSFKRGAKPAKSLSVIGAPQSSSAPPPPPGGSSNRILGEAASPSHLRPGAPRPASPEGGPSSPDPTNERLAHLGTLTVHIRHASELIKADFRGLSDPYAVVKIDSLTLESVNERQTEAKKQTLEPTWDEKLDFDGKLDDFLKATIEIKLFDEDVSWLASHMPGKALQGFNAKSMKFNLAEQQQQESGGHFTSFKRKQRDDKLGNVPAFALDWLATQDSKEFVDVELEGVKSGKITFTVSWTQTSDDDDQLRALVERDPEIRYLLKEVRKQQDSNAYREEKSERTPLVRSMTADLMKATSSAAAEAASISGILKCVHRTLGPVHHPDGRFRTVWNVMMAVLIIYCAISVPLEICFDTDMVIAMCGTGDRTDPVLPRAECPDYQIWFWGNVALDMMFICDVRPTRHHPPAPPAPRAAPGRGLRSTRGAAAYKAHFAQPSAHTRCCASFVSSPRVADPGQHSHRLCAGGAFCERRLPRGQGVPPFDGLHL